MRLLVYLFFFAHLMACTPGQRTTTLAIASTSLLFVDWRQTRGIAASCNEENPVIGWCGERVPPDVYFAFVIVAHLALGLAMHNGWDDAWFATIAGAEGATTWSNYRRKK